jgi:hypothetical protein
MSAEASCQVRRDARRRGAGVAFGAGSAGSITLARRANCRIRCAYSRHEGRKAPPGLPPCSGRSAPSSGLFTAEDATVQRGLRPRRWEIGDGRKGQPQARARIKIVLVPRALSRSRRWSGSDKLSVKTVGPAKDAKGAKGAQSARRWEIGVGRARRPRRAGGTGLKPDSRAKTPRRRETTNQPGLGPDPLRRGVSSEAGARKWIVVPKRGPAREAKGAKGERSAPSARGDRRWGTEAPSSKLQAPSS